MNKEFKKLEMNMKRTKIITNRMIQNLNISRNQKLISLIKNQTVMMMMMMMIEMIQTTWIRKMKMMKRMIKEKNFNLSKILMKKMKLIRDLNNYRQ